MHFPAIVGPDVSGTVVATGDGITDLKIGDHSTQERAGIVHQGR